VVTEAILQGIVPKEEDREDIMTEDLEVGVEAEAEVDNIEAEEDIIIDMIVEVIAEAVIVEVAVEIVKAEIIDIEEDLEVEKEVMIVIIEIKKGIEDPEVKEVGIAGIAEIAGIDLKKVGNLKIQKVQIGQEGKKDMLKIMIIITKKIILIVIAINQIMIVLIIKTIVIILKKKIIIKKIKLSGMRSN